MKTERLDFKEVNRLIAALGTTEKEFLTIFTDKEEQAEQIRSFGREIILEEGRKALAGIPVTELKQSKAGIRTGALLDAGYTDLYALSKAEDWELKTIEGIGDKQVAAIRDILTEFEKHLSERVTLKLHTEAEEEGDSPKNRGLIFSLAVYRRSELIRKDAEGMTEELREFVSQTLSQKLLLNRLQWIFSTKESKERTLGAIADILAFCQSPFYQRVQHFSELYRDVLSMSVSEAMEDFARNGAVYYTLLERVCGNAPAKPLIYSSIPAQLAAEVDAFPLNGSCFRGDLRAYQVFGAKYILKQERVLLGDEMGLGKTVQAVAAMAHIQAVEQKAYFLVVCPASVLINWCREIKRFSSIEVFLLHGEDLKPALFQWQMEGGAAVTNYESMGKIIEAVDERMKFSLLVIDEAHYIKNPGAKRTQYVRRLDNESDKILMMTGTPLENRVEEMCSLIDFIRPELSKEIRGFAHISHVPRFKEMLAPVYLRRTREQVLKELPPIEEKQEWCALTEADRSAYINEVSKKNFAGLRRVSFLQEDLSTSAKAQRLSELCMEAKEDGRKILIYSFFRDTIEKLAGLLAGNHVGVINGDTEISVRQTLIDRFAQAPVGSVLLCQVQAGGTGLNIQAASIVIFCEPQIKPSLTNQAIARVYRMGQVRNVLVYHLLCPQTIDEAMVDMLALKQVEFDTYADESVMSDAAEGLLDREWIGRFMEEEGRRYLPMVVDPIGATEAG